MKPCTPYQNTTTISRRWNKLSSGDQLNRVFVQRSNIKVLLVVLLRSSDGSTGSGSSSGSNGSSGCGGSNGSSSSGGSNGSRGSSSSSGSSGSNCSILTRRYYHKL